MPLNAPRNFPATDGQGGNELGLWHRWFVRSRVFLFLVIFFLFFMFFY